jgi:hypothetical protein
MISGLFFVFMNICNDCQAVFPRMSSYNQCNECPLSVISGKDVHHQLHEETFFRGSVIAEDRVDENGGQQQFSFDEEKRKENHHQQKHHVGSSDVTYDWVPTNGPKRGQAVAGGNGPCDSTALYFKTSFYI